MPELEMIDDATDYSFDIQGWLEDCLDEVDMRDNHETLLAMCDNLLTLFSWPEYTGSDIKFRKAAVYAFMDVKEYEKDEKLVDRFIIDRFIIDRLECGDENDIMFIAASKLYEAAGKKKEKKR